MAEQAHSRIGASSMYRWAACPGSVKLSAGIEQKSSVYAEEGSDAHALAADALKRNTPLPKYLGLKIEAEGRTFTVDKEMLDAVTVYVDHVRALSAHSGAITLIEQRFDLSSVHPGCFGTGDAVVYWPDQGLLHVVDYKHGAGLPVKVKDNPQLHYYALGALLGSDFRPRMVRMTIVQPRCDHPDGPVRSADIDAIDLLDFRSDLKKYAAATEAPDAPLVSGDHCRFCPAAPTCPQLHGQAQEAARMEFASVADSAAVPIDGDKLAKALGMIPALKAWIKRVDETAYAEAEAGRCPPGYKLVEKRATRDWRDQGAAIEFLQKQGFKDEIIFEPRVLLSPAKLEKIEGLKPKTVKGTKSGPLDAFTVRESSGHTLVPADDPRPPVKLAAKDEFTAIA